MQMKIQYHRQTKAEDEDDWASIWKVVAEHEENQMYVGKLVAIFRFAVIVKEVAPYATACGVVAWLLRDVILEMVK